MPEAVHTLTDKQIIAQHASSVRPRARVELAIVNKLIAVAAAANYTLQVVGVDEAHDVKTEIFSQDQSCVLVLDRSGTELGWVLLVRGNGEDLVSDYSLTLETFLQPVNDFSHAMECDR